MELTLKERLILMNQYAILEKLDPENAKDYANKYKALDYGFTLNYAWLFENMSEEMSKDECEEVINILNMYRAITFSYFTIHNTKNISDDRYKFKGFDGNEESKYYSYCNYFIMDLGRFQELTYGYNYPDLNSHSPMLKKYRLMLNIWEGFGEIDRRMNLDAAQIEALLEAK